MIFKDYVNLAFASIVNWLVSRQSSKRKERREDTATQGRDGVSGAQMEEALWVTPRHLRSYPQGLLKAGCWLSRRHAKAHILSLLPPLAITRVTKHWHRQKVEKAEGKKKQNIANLEMGNQAENNPVTWFSVPSIPPPPSTFFFTT